MRAIVLEKFGGLESLVYKEIPGRRAVNTLTSPSQLIRGIGRIFRKESTCLNC
jgi:hypothetical protein